MVKVVTIALESHAAIYRFYFIQHISILVLFSPTALYPATNRAIATFYSWWYQ